MTDHADLIARLRRHVARDFYMNDTLIREAADALADSVPREQYDEQVRLRNAHARQRDDIAREFSDQANERSSLQRGVVAATQRAETAEAQRDAAQKEVEWWEDWENKVIVHLHQNWEDDIAQIALLTNFIEHAAKLDSVIEDAREADDYEGNALTFAWDDDTRTLSAVSLARHDAEVKAQALEEAADEIGPYLSHDSLRLRAAAIHAEAAE